MINWGILALGKIAQKFAHDLALSDESRLFAVASRSGQRAREFAKQFGAEHAFDNYEALVQCPGVDVVYVASPHSHHAEHALLCLRNGVPVLCEKPLAVNLQQVEAIVGAAEENNTFLMEAMWTRFIPAFSHALELVQAGVIGSPQLLRADFGFRAPLLPEGRLYNPALAGGALLDIGIYPVFAALCFLGDPKRIVAQAKLTTTGVDETTAMVMTHHNGAISVLDCTIAANSHTRCTIHGDGGNITILSRFHEAEKVLIEPTGEEPTTATLPKAGIGLYHEIKAVEHALKNGWKQHPLMPHDLSRRLMHTLDRIRGEIGLRYPLFD